MSQPQPPFSRDQRFLWLLFKRGFSLKITDLSFQMSYHSGLSPYQTSHIYPWQDLTSDLPINPMIPGARTSSERLGLIKYSFSILVFLNYMYLMINLNYNCWINQSFLWDDSEFKKRGGVGNISLFILVSKCVKNKRDCSKI